MAWTVVTVECFDNWFLGLDASEQQDVLAAIFVLEQFGPAVRRPHVDSIKGTEKVKNLKELRVQHKGKPFRVFFAFDPLRQAVMLCGGDKTGGQTFLQNHDSCCRTRIPELFARIGVSDGKATFRTNEESKPGRG